jgi:uncharacterized protein YfaS (alpha-2-macroglobulin family)
LIITTDKVVYRPNDVAFIEVVLLDIFNKTPIIPDPASYEYYNYYLSMNVFDPKETQVFTDSGYAQNSTLSFTFKVPENAAGGQYKVSCGSYSIQNAFKTFRVQDYPR